MLPFRVCAPSLVFLRRLPCVAVGLLAVWACGETNDGSEAPSEKVASLPNPRPATSVCLLDEVLTRGTVQSPWSAARRQRSPQHTALVATQSRLPTERSDVWAAVLDVGRDFDQAMTWVTADGKPIHDVGVGPFDVAPARPETGWGAVVPAVRRLPLAAHPSVQRGFAKPRTPGGAPGVRMSKPVRMPIWLMRTGVPLTLGLEARVLGVDGGAALPTVQVEVAGEVVGAFAWDEEQRSVPHVVLAPAEGMQEVTLVVTGIVEGPIASHRLVLTSLVASRDDGFDRLWLEGVADAEHATVTYAPRLNGTVSLLEPGEVLEGELAVPLALTGTISLTGPAKHGLVVMWNGKEVGRSSNLRAREAAFQVDGVEGGSLRLRAPRGPLRGPLTLVQRDVLAREEHVEIRGREQPVSGAASEVVRHVFFDDVGRRGLLLMPGTEVRVAVRASASRTLEWDLGLCALGAGVAPLLPPQVTWSWDDSGGERILDTVQPTASGQWEPQVLTLPEGEGTLVVASPADEHNPVRQSTLVPVVGRPRLTAPQRPDRPNVLIYLIDTLRADHLSCYGYERPTTPNLDALAQDGILFERCHAQSPWTRPSVASVFTGLLYSFHGAGKVSGLSPRLITLAERLRNAGYQTAAFSTNAQIHGAGLNFAQGFEVFEGIEAELGASRANDVNARALPWLEDHRDTPWFLYLHTLDPHAKYDPLPEVRGRFGSNDYQGTLNPQRTGSKNLETASPLTDEDLEYILALYDEEILFNDQQFGVLIESLKASGQYDDTLILVLSDHGEEFGEHGKYGHGGRLWQSLLHVPFLWKLPARDGVSQVRLDDPVRIADVLPTVCGLLGLETDDAPIHGTDLSARMRGGPATSDDVIAEEEPGLRALIRQDLKLIEEDLHRPDRATAALYDLASPDEQTNLAGARPDDVARLQDAVLKLLASYNREMSPISEGPLQVLNEATRRALIEMGYLDD